MATYRIYKETALPGSLTAHSIYLIAPAAHPGYLEIYVTDAAGTAHRRTPTIPDIEGLIADALGSVSQIEIVDNIAARDALTVYNGLQALVLDASADATVDAGAATYIYRSSTTSWIKISEAESLDVAITWAALSRKPTSAVADIDDAVTKRHTHTNKTQLDKIGEDVNGDFTYNGGLPVIAWTSTAW